MEHKRVDQLRSVADVASHLPKEMLTRRERLERWADLLERDPLRRLSSLGEIEFQPAQSRHLLRADNSPLTVAFSDPVLRSQGLAGDRLGDATSFFGLSEGDAHRVLCSCLNGRVMDAGTTARRVRAIASQRDRTLVAAGIATMAVVSVPMLAYLFG
jgi:hypothetical protein